MTDKLPEKNDEFVVFHIRQDGLLWATLPAYGFIDRIEIRPVNDTLNINAALPLRLGWRLFDGNGKEVELEVKLICRGIKQ